MLFFLKIFTLIVVFANFCYLKSQPNDLDSYGKDLRIEDSFENNDLELNDNNAVKILKDIKLHKYGNDTSNILANFFWNINFDVHPCNDFFNFTCENWNIKDETNEITNKKYDFDEFIGNEIFVFKYLIYFSETHKEDLIKKSKAIKLINEMNEKCVKSDLEHFRNFCIEEVTKFGTYAFVSHYIKHLTSNQKFNLSLVILQEMADIIINEYKKLVKETDSLDEFSKITYIEILDSIENDIGHFENLADIQFMEKCYSYSNFSMNDNVLDMVEDISNYESFIPDGNNDLTDRCTKYIKYQRSYNNVELSTLTDERGYHDTPSKKFIIYLSFLKHPHFDPTFPMPINFGSAGFLISRKLIHHVDRIYKTYRSWPPLGPFFAPFRALYSPPLPPLLKTWYPVTSNTRITECFIQQYNKQTDNRTKNNVDGRRTLIENLADNGGIKLAHRALMKYLKEKNILNETIEHNTMEKLFFIGYGSYFCERHLDILLGF
uniref:Peptidase_M13 domain-containing protein n=1 Tax=Strongyloides papillosus TaxID=174720 RepID=A0A0N5BD94_STREA